MAKVSIEIKSFAGLCEHSVQMCTVAFENSTTAKGIACEIFFQRRN